MVHYFAHSHLSPHFWAHVQVPLQLQGPLEHPHLSPHLSPQGHEPLHLHVLLEQSHCDLSLEHVQGVLLSPSFFWAHVHVGLHSQDGVHSHVLPWPQLHVGVHSHEGLQLHLEEEDWRLVFAEGMRTMIKCGVPGRCPSFNTFAPGARVPCSFAPLCPLHCALFAANDEWARVQRHRVHFVIGAQSAHLGPKHHVA